MVDPTGTHRVHGYCALCIARCGCVAVVEDGRFTRLEPDPAHPIGQALCAKGRVAPELVYHPERLTHPLRRTRPKGDPDPGWERIDWDEALDLIAAAMRRIAERQGPEAVAFSMCSGSTFAGTRGNGRDAPIPVIAGAARLHPKQSFVAHRQSAFRGLLGDIPLIDVEQSVSVPRHSHGSFDRPHPCRTRPPKGQFLPHNYRESGEPGLTQNFENGRTFYDAR
jgi:hypothetical protein